MQDQVVTHSPLSSPAWPTPPRPSRPQVEPAALALLARHSAGLLATARRYSASPEDAEDAYQRGVEILLTKAPTTSEAELLPWLRTVVKHEAFAVRKSNGRAQPVHSLGTDEPDPGAWTDARAERFERLRVGAEALAGLKPQEIRCLLLRAEGLSYREICDATGWTYTKVNRSITEGRRAFLKRVASIETGAECEQLAPLISKAADGEASAEEMGRVRPHLKSCLACKATLREYRATPARLAGLVPPVVALAGAPARGGWTLRALHALQDRLGALAEPKAAAIAASAALLAGGGAAGVSAIGDHPARVPASAFAHRREVAAPRVARASGDPGALAAATPIADPAPVSPAPTVFNGSAKEMTAPADPAAGGAGAAPAAQGEFDPGTPAPGTSDGGSAQQPASAPAGGGSGTPSGSTSAPAQQPASTPPSGGSGAAEFGP